jgi:hypothetical protein
MTCGAQTPTSHAAPSPLNSDAIQPRRCSGVKSGLWPQALAVVEKDRPCELSRTQLTVAWGISANRSPRGSQRGGESRNNLATPTTGGQSPQDAICGPHCGNRWRRNRRVGKDVRSCIVMKLPATSPHRLRWPADDQEAENVRLAVDPPLDSALFANSVPKPPR